MIAFTYQANPARVVFGDGTLAALPDEVARLGLSRALVLATPAQEADAHRTATLLGPRAAGVFAGATMHTPVEVTERAVAVARDLRADGVVAVGGGSTTGLAKAIALRTDLPQIVVPTTYAGSEMTPILGETKDGAKLTQSSPRALPEVVIYDVALTLTLPHALSGTSGINAIAHAVEALYARDRNPVISLLALDGIARLARALPSIVDDPTDRAARADALQGAWLCGLCLGAVGMALHHKLCHTLGGGWGLPHAETHTAVLPHALAYNAPAIPETIERLATVLGPDPARALYDLAARVGAARGLGALGLPADAVELVADAALANPYWNPRPLEWDPITRLLRDAHAGTPPRPQEFA